ncbi:hypothetical protein [Compostibacter hankyongensis]|uniref:Uncharacterized protein n=1 Tax=Compostibacter hankyongensis TaxID=1007089 RepID=A0ABP8FP76_9BACT
MRTPLSQAEISRILYEKDNGYIGFYDGLLSHLTAVKFFRSAHYIVASTLSNKVLDHLHGGMDVCLVVNDITETGDTIEVTVRGRYVVQSFPPTESMLPEAVQILHQPGGQFTPTAAVIRVKMQHLSGCRISVPRALKSLHAEEVPREAVPVISFREGRGKYSSNSAPVGEPLAVTRP